MNTQPQPSHILMIDIVGRAKASDDALNRSLAILVEVVNACETYGRAQELGQAVTYAEPGRLVILFTEDATWPVRCALELWETLRLLPSMSVRMAIHRGPVQTEPGSSALVSEPGDTIDQARNLLRTGQEGQILISDAYAGPLGAIEEWASRIREVEGDTSSESVPRRRRTDPQTLFFLDTEAGLGEAASALASALTKDGHETSHDHEGPQSLEWAKHIEDRIRSADAVVAFISDDSANSEFLQFQLDVASDERRKSGKPQILPVWLRESPLPDGPLAALNQNLHYTVWQSPADNERVVMEVRAALESGLIELGPKALNSDAGAFDNLYYVHRPTDGTFERALRTQESIVLVKGPHQMGKTLLIRRGIELVQELGWRIVSTDFQKLGSFQLESESEFYRVIANTICQQLGFEYDFEGEWLDGLAAGLNMDGFMRTLLEASEVPLVWFIDDADRLFPAPFASDFFALVRSWHNARAIDPEGPRGRLTVVIGYATEAHLFIKDLSRSPFNVGVPVRLEMFDLANVRDLNERYGGCLSNTSDLESLHRLLGGQPFLTQRAFELLSKGVTSFEKLVANADRDDGPFGDHLKRILLAVSQLSAVGTALSSSFDNPDLPDSEGLQRLIAAGVLVRRSEGGYELPSDLYRRYLARFFHQGQK